MLTARNRYACGLFAAIFLLLIVCRVAAADDGAGNDAREETEASESGSSSDNEDEGESAPDREARFKLNAARNAFQQGRCRDEGLVSYHGRCMTAEDREARFAFDLKHAQNMLEAATMLYKTDSPHEVGWMFQRAEEFIGEFDEDAQMDRQIAERVLPLLGYIYLAADRISNEMKTRLKSRPKVGEPLKFLDDRAEMESFQSKVQMPMLTLFGEQIDVYISLYGRRSFAKLMYENGLQDVLRGLERSGN